MIVLLYMWQKKPKIFIVVFVVFCLVQKRLKKFFSLMYLKHQAC